MHFKCTNLYTYIDTLFIIMYKLLVWMHIVIGFYRKFTPNSWSRSLSIKKWWQAIPLSSIILFAFELTKTGHLRKKAISKVKEEYTKINYVNSYIVLCNHKNTLTIIKQNDITSKGTLIKQPITVHLELYLFYRSIHFLLYIGQYWLRKTW